MVQTGVCFGKVFKNMMVTQAMVRTAPKELRQERFVESGSVVAIILLLPLPNRVGYKLRPFAFSLVGKFLPAQFAY
jgi:hypothetical protein